MNLFDQKKHMLVLFCSPNPHGSTRRLLGLRQEGEVYI